ncbi:mersacidin/lichenicidin family type 2 lantibiotic [Streptomyces milbemycinicus]|uniref:mersacidin/lichenicidin family type 2 lantibiotic n=1 Tax=Streptomyces milbemycinicus TaxID=476552 RepID=UPI0033DD188B
MNSTVTAWKDAMCREGLGAGPDHPAGVANLIADLPIEEGSAAAATLSTQPFFDCCG